jgi:hypothetical protein
MLRHEINFSLRLAKTSEYVVCYVRDNWLRDAATHSKFRQFPSLSKSPALWQLEPTVVPGGLATIRIL